MGAQLFNMSKREVRKRSFETVPKSMRPKQKAMGAQLFSMSNKVVIKQRFETVPKVNANITKVITV